MPQDIERMALMRGIIGPDPAGTPPAVIHKISTEIVKRVNRPDIRKQLLEMGAAPVGNAPAEMAAQIPAGLLEYGAVAKQVRLVGDPSPAAPPDTAAMALATRPPWRRQK